MKPTTLITDKGRVCTACGVFKPWGEYRNGSGALGKTSRCSACLNAEQRARRKKTGNADTKKYERDTKRGFLMRLYRNMESRVTGVQRSKQHLYAGVKLLPREKFYEWALADKTFHSLWDAWVAAGKPRRLTPSVDRVDSFYGYEIWNMEWVTHSENSRRGSLSRHGIRGSGYAA